MLFALSTVAVAFATFPCVVQLPTQKQPQASELIARLAAEKPDFAADALLLASDRAAFADSTFDQFRVALDAEATYGQLYRDYVAALAHAVANLTTPHFARSKASCATVFQSMSDSFTLGGSWITSTCPVGGSFTLASSTGGSTAVIEQLALYPFTLADVSLEDAPADIAAALSLLPTADYDAFYYSARFDGATTHSGIATIHVQNNVQALSLLPDYAPAYGSIFSAADTAAICWLDSLGAIDWAAAYEALFPAYEPPQWTLDLGSDVAARVLGNPDLWDCIYSAYLEYEAAMRADADALEQWRKTNEANRPSVVLATGSSRDSIHAMFRANGGDEGSTLGGMTADQWNDYLNDFYEDAQSEYEEAEASRKAWEKERVCANTEKFRDDVIDCIGECEEPALAAFINDWAAKQCP